MAQKKSDVVKREPNDKDWDRARALFLNGSTYEQIVKAMPTVKLSIATISRKFCKEKMTERKKGIDERVLDSLIVQTEAARKQVNESCIELFNKGSEVINTLLNNCRKELSGAPLSKGQARATAYNVDLLMSGVTKIQKGLRVAYGMDDSGKLYEKEPEVLVIENLDNSKI